MPRIHKLAGLGIGEPYQKEADRLDQSVNPARAIAAVRCGEALWQNTQGLWRSSVASRCGGALWQSAVARGPFCLTRQAYLIKSLYI